MTDTDKSILANVLPAAYGPVLSLIEQRDDMRDAIEAADRAKIVLIGGSVLLLAEDWQLILDVKDSLAKKSRWNCQACGRPLEADPMGTAGLCGNCGDSLAKGK